MSASNTSLERSEVRAPDAFGPHSLSYPAHGVLLITVHGILEEEHMRELLQLFERCEDPVVAIVGDARKLVKIRKRARQLRARHPTALERRGYEVHYYIISDSVVRRATATVMLTAVSLATGRKIHARFFKTRDEALAQARARAEHMLGAAGS